MFDDDGDEEVDGAIVLAVTTDWVVAGNVEGAKTTKASDNV